MTKYILHSLAGILAQTTLNDQRNGLIFFEKRCILYRPRIIPLYPAENPAIYDCRVNPHP